jgi:hypothetical protein
MPPSFRVAAISILACALPVLVAVFAPLNLITSNLGEVATEDGFRSIVVLGLFAIALALGTTAVFRSLSKAILLTTIILVVLLSYGHVYNMVRQLSIAGVLVGRHRYLLPVALGVIALAAAGIGVAKQPQRGSLAIMSLLALGMVAWTLVPILRFTLAARAADASAVTTAPTISVEDASSRAHLPDIYYIVLDAHGRADSLESIYGYNSSSFVSDLEAMGFFVADSSQSNYATTSLSLASSLNMMYLDKVAEAAGYGSDEDRIAEVMLNHSQVLELANQLGYTTIAFESAAPAITFETADELMTADFSQSRQDSALLGGLALTPFEGILLETTVGRVLFDWFVGEQNRLRPLVSDVHYQTHRERILFQLLSLPSIAAREGPKLVVVHVMAPHPPYVFGPRGEQVENPRAFSLQDVGCCTAEDYIARYRDQVMFIDQLLGQSLAAMLAASAERPIIVIQGDHGPGATLDWGEPSELGRKERMAILNAYLVPEHCRQELYPDISPVNTFRLIFGPCLGLDYELLPDESFFSSHLRDFDFSSVEDGVFE